MIREREKVHSLFEGKDIIVDWAQVEERLEEDDLLKIVKEYHGIICGDDKITKRVLKCAENLQVIVKWGTGIDSIDSTEAKNHRIPVRRTLDAFTEPVADSTLSAILSFARSILINDRLMKNGLWEKPRGLSLSEVVIGIIGLGNTGTAVAKRLHAFGSRVLANDIVKKNTDLIKKLNIEMVTKEEIYQMADFICIHCDLNDTSFHLFNENVFSKMKKKSVIINMARGPIIKEIALIDALISQKISGAALDVFEEEPLPINSPLRKMDNVLLSAHNSNSSPYYWQRVHNNSVRMLLEGLDIE